MVRIREVAKYRYIFAGLLTLLVFTTGMLFSDFMDSRRENSLQNEMSRNLVDMEGQQLHLSYLQSGDVRSCDAMQAGVRDIIDNYNDRLTDVQQYQSNSLFQSSQFEIIRDRYVLSGIRYYLFVTDLKQECGMNTSTVLFFTESLESEECEECQQVGRELELIKTQYGEDVLIFSIPSTMDSGVVDVMERQYNVTERPTLVINSNKTLEGTYSRQRLEEEIID